MIEYKEKGIEVSDELMKWLINTIKKNKLQDEIKKKMKPKDYIET